MLSILLLFCFSMLICLSGLFFFMSHPLSLALALLLTALASCFLWGILLSSWYSLLIMLLYVGALLVLFAYISALTPNFKFSTSFLAYFGPVFFVMIGLPAQLASSSFSGFSIQFTNFLSNVRAWDMAMPSSGGIMLLMTLGVVLLACLISVVTICKSTTSALRGWK